jgi:ribulose 1,5-bisphosphate synthetase/thiazole synthase
MKVRAIEAICQDIEDLNDKISAAKAVEATGKDAKVKKQIELATLDRRMVQLVSEKTAWIDAGRELWVKANDAAAARKNGPAPKTE